MLEVKSNEGQISSIGSFYLLFNMFFQVKSVFGAKMFALGVVVKIPVPKQTAKTSFTVTSGRAKYNAAIDCLVWKYVSHFIMIFYVNCEIKSLNWLFDYVLVKT
jgi:hypothetical protein